MTKFDFIRISRHTWRICYCIYVLLFDFIPFSYLGLQIQLFLEVMVCEEFVEVGEHPRHLPELFYSNILLGTSLNWFAFVLNACDRFTETHHLNIQLNLFPDASTNFVNAFQWNRNVETSVEMKRHKIWTLFSSVHNWCSTEVYREFNHYKTAWGSFAVRSSLPMVKTFFWYRVISLSFPLCVE